MKFLKSTLGKIALEIKTGKTPPTSNPEYFGDKLNWYTPTDLDREKILGKSKRRITQKALIDKKVVVLKPNTILLGCIGDIGKIGLIKESASSNQQITGILPKEEILNSEFLYYWLKNNKNKLRDASTSAIVSILNNKQLSTIKIEFPESLDDQIRISEILTQAENLITQRKESISLLDELLKSTFLEMFGDPVRNEKGWELVPLSQLGSLDRGVSKHRPRNAPELLGGEYPLIQTGEVSNSGLYITKFTKSYSELGLKQSKIWNEGTLLITIAANIAQTSILTFKACFPDSIVGFISLKNESNTIFVHYLFSFFQAILEKNAPQAAQRNINLELLRKLLVPKPPIKLQNMFVTIVEKVEVLKKEYEASLRELENMYGVLSQKAFKGELDLSKTAIPDVIINSNTFLEKPLEEVSDNNSEYLDINIEQKIDEIIKKYKNEKLFSIDMIHRELDQYKVQFNITQAKVYIKQLMEKDIIIQEYSGDTKQVMFKLKK